MPIQLTRPLIVLDLETTGVNPKHDRIVELAALKCLPDGGREEFVRRLNPERPIPPEATAIHGIRDQDVAPCPTFAAVAADLLRFLAGADLAGFGVTRFDLPLLVEEFRRAGMELAANTMRVVDAQRIYHLREPRTLSAALRFYCHAEHAGAHGARADVLATLSVLEAQLEHYADLPHDVEGLDRYCNPKSPDALDPDGRLRWRGPEVVLTFGQKNGMTLRELATREPAYLRWMLNRDFSPEVKAIVRDVLNGRYPQRPAGRADEE